jgi:hypothetical protein
VLFLLPELSAMVQKPSLAKQLSPLRCFDDFLPFATITFIFTTA